MKFKTFASFMLTMATIGACGGYLLGRAAGVAMEQKRWVGHFDVEVAGRAKAEDNEQWCQERLVDCTRRLFMEGCK